MQSKTQLAGILTVISGVFGILGLGFMFGYLYLLRTTLTSNIYGMPFLTDRFYTFMAIFYLIIGFFAAILGILAIVGGIFSLKKQMWGWSLAGTIAGVITFFPTGIPAIILLAMGRDEFHSPQSITPKGQE
jgi:hypothetical protein